jgi:hypothetical protein
MSHGSDWEPGERTRAKCLGTSAFDRTFRQWEASIPNESPVALEKRFILHSTSTKLFRIKKISRSNLISRQLRIWRQPGYFEITPWFRGNSELRDNSCRLTESHPLQRRLWLTKSAITQHFRMTIDLLDPNPILVQGNRQSVIRLGRYERAAQRFWTKLPQCLSITTWNITRQSSEWMKKRPRQILMSRVWGPRENDYRIFETKRWVELSSQEVPEPEIYSTLCARYRRISRQLG